MVGGTAGEGAEKLRTLAGRPFRVRSQETPADPAGAACYIHAMGKLSPIESEFSTTEDAEAYERWFRAKVEASLADRRPVVLHPTVMAELDRIIDEAEQHADRS